MTFHTTDGLSPVAQGVRRAIEDEIERLIGLLDTIAGDSDDEPNGDEMDACSPWEVRAECVLLGEDDEPAVGYGARADAKGDCDREFDDADLEWSLGWTEEFNQASPPRFMQLGLGDGEAGAGDVPETDCDLAGGNAYAVGTEREREKREALAAFRMLDAGQKGDVLWLMLAAVEVRGAA